MGLLCGLIRSSGFTVEEIRKAKTWETLGRYISKGKIEDIAAPQAFLKRFTHMQWRQYSGLSHATFDGYIG